MQIVYESMSLANQVGTSTPAGLDGGANGRGDHAASDCQLVKLALLGRRHAIRRREAELTGTSAGAVSATNDLHCWHMSSIQGPGGQIARRQEHFVELRGTAPATLLYFIIPYLPLRCACVTSARHENTGSCVADAADL